MSSEELSVRVDHISKRYEIYAQPIDRLKQMVLPRLRRSARMSERAYFGEFWALRDVDFEVRRGETIGIVGRNGSGKSTLLQIICGTLSPTEGEVKVNGRIAALLELGAGFNPEFTGRENIRLSGLLYGLSEGELLERYDDILKFAEIGDFINQPVKTYSSGMYVRLAFAIAINVSPDILVIDEALSVGDESFQRKCFARIEKIRESGATILFVSHSAGTVIELCNKALLLDTGELLVQGSPKHVISRYHKLLYAPVETTAKLRAAIRSESSGGDADGHAVVETAQTSPLDEKDGADALSEEAYLDEGLVPKSTMSYERRGARIDAPAVYTVSQRKVNVLRGNGEYAYSFRVAFDKHAAGVRFGMAIKTISGLALGGCATASNPADGLNVEPGQTYVARFRFRALLAPGVYFLNAGITAVEPEGDIFLDRIIDAVMIRIMPDSRRLATEFVDFDMQPEVEPFEGMVE